MTKWTEDRTAQLCTLAGNETPVSRATVASIADEMEISSRSASSKLRKEGYNVETAGAAPKAFSDEETAVLQQIVTNNSGELTYAEIAEQLGSDHTARAVQGKILSMELTSHVRPTPPKEVEREFTDEMTQKVVSMANDGKFVEEIAEAVGKSVQSVRGRCLGLLRAGDIKALPTQRDRKPAARDVFEDLGDSVSGMTVEQLVAETGKTARGVKTILTRRGLKAADYDGAAKSEKAAANAAA